MHELQNAKIVRNNKMLIIKQEIIRAKDFRRLQSNICNGTEGTTNTSKNRHNKMRKQMQQEQKRTT